MSIKYKNDVWYYVFLMAFVLLSRLPFIFDGYGLDGDAWSVAITADHLQQTGEYNASRLPGFPVHEFLCAMFVKFGYVGLNLISAIFSSIAILFFALILKVLRFRRIFLASVALSMVPIFYIHSTTTIDYVIALSFVLVGMYFLLRNRNIAAGIFIGLAIGTRITSGAMLIPFSILLIEFDGFKNNFKRISRLIIPALVTGLILFLPVLQKYGLGFFTYYNIPYPTVSKVLYKFFIEVWGIIGLIGILFSTALFFLPDHITKKKFLFPRSVNEKFVVAWLVSIDLYIIAFLKLPMESGYLIPIIPFVILIFGKYLFDRAFVFLCVMLILSSVFCTISPKDRLDAVTPSSVSFNFNAGGEKLYFDVLKGPILSYKIRRENGIKFVDRLLSSTDSIKNKSVIVSGRWYNQMVVQCGDTNKLKFILRSYLTEDDAVFFYAKDYTIYYLPKQDYYNKVMKNVDLEIYGATPYFKDEKTLY